MIIGLEEDRQGLLNKRLEAERAETLAQVNAHRCACLQSGCVCIYMQMYMYITQIRAGRFRDALRARTGGIYKRYVDTSRHLWHQRDTSMRLWMCVRVCVQLHTCTHTGMQARASRCA